MSLKHPMSVDTYVERTARHARLIVVRALGGASYFHYALEALHAVAARQGALIAVLPGDSKPDPGLTPFSNVALDDLNGLWSYLIEGGDANSRLFLAYAGSMLSGVDKPQPALPLMKAGIWWPGLGVIGVEEWRRVTGSATLPASRVAAPPLSARPTSPPQGGRLTCREDLRLQRSPPLWGRCPTGQRGISPHAPTIAISFYRALVQSGETRPVEAMIDALLAEGIRPLPVFAYSLKTPYPRHPRERLCRDDAGCRHQYDGLCSIRPGRRSAADGA